LDQIHNCFKRYKFWSLKSLKAELKQPEAYLRQTLELVAHLVRQGPHAMTWQLKNRDAYDVQDKTAPDPGYGLDGVSDSGEGIASDDDDVQLEDAMP
jgi:transcription initiation factor TFIIF subunit beta